MTTQKPRVLIVDDFLEIGETLADILTREGYEARTAASGEEAVEMARSEAFSAAVLDVVLRQGIDGFETARRLDELQPGLPIFFVTAYFDEARHDPRRKLHSGPLMEKPVPVVDLLKALREAVDSRAAT